MNLLNEASDSRFVTRKWNIVTDQSSANYDVGNEIIYNTEVLKSNLCDCNDVYILVRGDISVVESPATQVAFENFALITKCITKIDETTIDHAEDLDLIIPMYNLIEYRSSYSDVTVNLWFHSKNEGTDFDANIADTPGFTSFHGYSQIIGKYSSSTCSKCCRWYPRECSNRCTIKIPK